MKGSMLNRYKVGDAVVFNTSVLFGSQLVKVKEEGRITKLHRSGSHGVAEIRRFHPNPITGSMRKASRSLRHVEVKQI